VLGAPASANTVGAALGEVDTAAAETGACDASIETMSWLPSVAWV
jgi:hypothetical protein